MANYLIINQNYVQNGLGTLTYTVPTTGTYSVQFQGTVNPPSSLSVAVKDGSSTLFTSPALTPTQEGLEFKYTFTATATDSITVVLTGNTDTDLQLNSVKANISIYQGG